MISGGKEFLREGNRLSPIAVSCDKRSLVRRIRRSAGSIKSPFFEQCPVFEKTKAMTLTSLFAHARSRKAISSSRPKTSLPVTGNLATEIFFGASLAGGLRVPTREAVEGVFRRLSRVILRRASIAPVIVGIAFSSSVGLWKRCAGSF